MCAPIFFTVDSGTALMIELNVGTMTSMTLGRFKKFIISPPRTKMPATMAAKPITMPMKIIKALTPLVNSLLVLVVSHNYESYRHYGERENEKHTDVSVAGETAMTRRHFRRVMS
jgi:hypothetical protein